MRAPLFFDRIARVYRWGEYLGFGKALEGCRFCFLAEVSTASKILTLGEGDGRFLVELLKKNSQAMADAVDVSPVMLSLLQSRVQAAGAEKQLRTHCTDVRDFAPGEGGYDLVVTHFFLDCLSENEIAQLMNRLRPHLAPHCRWLVSDFAIPAKGVAKLFGTAVVSALYLGFWLLTNLQIRRLPLLSSVWHASGFESKGKQEFLGGLIYSEIRERASPAA